MFSNFLKSVVTRLSFIVSLALVATSFTPGVAQAAVPATTANASYEIPFTWGADITPATSTANKLTFTSTMAKTDVSGYVGKPFTFTPNLTVASPLATSNFESSASVTFFDSSSNQLGDTQIIEASDSTSPNVLKSVVFPANASSFSAVFISTYERLSASDPAIPQSAINLDYTVNVDGVTVLVEKISGSTPASSDFFVFNDQNRLSVSGITGAYTVPAAAVSSKFSLYTCVDTTNAAIAAGTAYIYAIAKSNGTNVSGLVKAGVVPHIRYSDTIPQPDGLSVSKTSFAPSSNKLSKSLNPALFYQPQILVEFAIDENYPIGQSQIAGTNGNRGPFQLSVVNGSGVEVSTPCVVAPFNDAPTVSAASDKVNLLVSRPNELYSDHDLWRVSFYREDDPTTAIYKSEIVDSSVVPDLYIAFEGFDLPVGVRLTARLIRVMNASALQPSDAAAPFSVEGPDSPAFVIPVNKDEIFSSISNGSGPGQLNMKTVPGSENDYSVTSQGGSVEPFSDGETGLFKLVWASTPDHKATPVVLYHLTQLGMDTDLGGTGNPGLTVYSGNDALNPKGGWMGARDKWVAMVSHGLDADHGASFDSASIGVKMVTGSLGSNQVVETDFTGAQMNSFCDSVESGSK